MPTIRRTAEGTYLATVCHATRTYRKRHKTRQAARTWCDQMTMQLGIGGYPLDSWTTADVYSALEVLPEGRTLTEAAQMLAQSSAPRPDDIPLDQCVRRYLDDRKAAGMRQRSLYQLSSLLTRASAVGGTVGSVTGQALIDWLADQKVSPTTRNNYRRALHGFFAWTVVAGYRTDNPATAIGTVRQANGRPGILSPDQTEALFLAAERTHPEMCAYLALAFFAGIRPGELMRMRWPAIGFREIEVGGDVSKTRDHRYVPIMPNLREWLDRYDDSGPICPVRESARDRRLVAIRQAAGLTDWPHDVARHSFGSYYLSLYSLSDTQSAMGHSTSDVLFRHYRRAVTRADAERYFAIRPSASNVQ